MSTSSPSPEKVAAPLLMGAATLPDICVRVAGSVDSVTAIVKDRRQYWKDYLTSDEAQHDQATCKLIEGLLKVYSE